jgi:hypothetical protein
MPVSKAIRVKVGYSKKPHAAFAVFALAVYETLLGNSHFPKPPVALARLKELIDEYQTLVAAAMDRGRNAILQRNSLRRELEKLVSQLGRYVEAASNDDPAIFATTVFERRSPTRSSPQQPETPRVLKAAHGANSGVIDLTLSPSLGKIKMYQVRFGIQDSEEPPTDWTVEVFSNANGPVSIRNLEPRRRYAFQVRALGAHGFTDWSDSVTIICV